MEPLEAEQTLDTLRARIEGHEGTVYSVAIVPGGALLLSGSMDGTVAQWEVATGVRVRSYTGHTDAVRCVVALEDGARFLSGDEVGKVRLWSLEGGEALRVIGGHTQCVHSLALWR